MKTYLLKKWHSWKRWRAIKKRAKALKLYGITIEEWKTRSTCLVQYSHGPQARTIPCGQHSPELGYLWLCPEHRPTTTPPPRIP